MNSLKEIIVSFMKEEDGFGVVEVILIIVVLIGLVIIFRDSITNVIENIFDTISERVDEV
ncbi:MAG: hypothetical protein K0S61_3528 [Anaerocolumna sp.]|nr:hypothetical protein [Anaerocolumna sp.]